MRILYLEDDVKINTLVEESLLKQAFTVDACLNGQKAIALFTQNEYDIIILDIMMEGINGLDVAKHIRKKNLIVPIIALTAKSDIESKVEALEIGFDDYVYKPFKVAELVAVIRVHIRRSSNQGNTFRAGDLELFPSTKVVRENEIEITLTRKEYLILEYLMKNKGIFKSDISIIQNIWANDEDVGSNVIAVHIKNIKKKLKNSSIIITGKGLGYKVLDN